MAKVIYTEWLNKELDEHPEVYGVYEDGNEGYRVRESVEKDLKEEGFDTEEDVTVWIEEIEIVRDETITQKEIDVVMNALSGTPTLTTAEFANKIEKILKHYKVYI